MEFLLEQTDFYISGVISLSHLKVRATVSESERGSSHRPSRCHAPGSQSRLHVEIIGELQKNPDPGPPALEVLISLGWGTDWTWAFCEAIIRSRLSTAEPQAQRALREGWGSPIEE